MFKKILLVLLSLLILSSCNKEQQTLPNQANNQEKPIVNQQDAQKSTEMVENVLDTSQFSEQLAQTPITLALQKEANNMSRLVATLTNNTAKTIQNIKINVHYHDEASDRILYYAQPIAPNQISETFRILGPNSNNAKDIEIKDITIVFDDGSNMSYSNNQNAEIADAPKPNHTNQIISSGETKRIYSFYQFGGLIIEANDVQPTLEISNGTLSAYFTNTSNYPITSYVMTIHDGQKEIMLSTNEIVSTHEVGHLNSIATDFDNLDTFTIVSLVVEADYETNKTLKTEFNLTGDITASYVINSK